MKYRILNFLLRLGRFVMSELPFILIFTFCLVPTTLKDMLLNPQRLSASKYLVLAFLFAVIFSLVARKFKGGGRIVTYFLAVSLFAVYMVLWLVFHTSISPLILQFIIETNQKEASECIEAFFLSKGAILSYVAVFLLIVVIVWAERWWRKSRIYAHIVAGNIRMMVVGGLASLLLLAGVFNMSLYYRMFQCKYTTELDDWGNRVRTFPMDAITAMIYSFYSPTVTQREVKEALCLAKQIYQSPLTDNVADSIHVIYILGESYIKHHASLYGYPLKTTPFMDSQQEKGQLVAFTDVVSPFNSTTLAQKNSFCCNSLADGEEWYKTAFFPILFKRAGYRVTLWDIQRNFQLNANYTFSVNAYFYHPEVQRYAYHATCNKSFDYDGQLVDDFLQTEAKKVGKKNLVLFHFLGQHVGASERFPHTAAYTRFTPKDIRRSEKWMTDAKRQDIADYDNATYYNDCVIRRIAEYYQDKPAVMIYFSDHGEEVYDYRDSKGRVACNGDWRNFLRYQYEIPFVVWFSKSYMQRYPQMVKDVQTAKNRPFTTDNVCQMLFHLTGMKTPWYHADRDILSPQYKPRKRILVGKDYDILKAKGKRK